MKSRVWPGVKAFDDLQTIEDMKSPMVTGTGKEGKCSRTYIYSRQIRLDFSVNGNPLGMPDAAVQAIHEAVQHVGEYPDITAAALTEAVSRM